MLISPEEALKMHDYMLLRNFNSPPHLHKSNFIITRCDEVLGFYSEASGRACYRKSVTCVYACAVRTSVAQYRRAFPTKPQPQRENTTKQNSVL